MFNERIENIKTIRTIKEPTINYKIQHRKEKDLDKHHPELTRGNNSGKRNPYFKEK